jgi:hypothetical protein
MFIGHYALGLACKRVEPRLSLVHLLAAPQVLDLVWPILVLAGVEHVAIAPGNTAFTPLAFISYPWSHSLVAAVAWGLVYAGIVRVATGASRPALVAGALVVSHWVLDWASHAPDMPLWPGSARYGLGLWDSVPLTLAVESVLFAGGTWLYARATRPRDRTGRLAFAGLVAFLYLVYVANAFGPLPPSANAVAASALALWLIPLWGWWIERHRESV